MEYCEEHKQEFIEAWPETLICDECYTLNMGGKVEEHPTETVRQEVSQLYNQLIERQFNKIYDDNGHFRE